MTTRKLPNHIEKALTRPARKTARHQEPSKTMKQLTTNYLSIYLSVYPSLPLTLSPSPISFMVFLPPSLSLSLSHLLPQPLSLLVSLCHPTPLYFIIFLFVSLSHSPHEYGPRFSSFSPLSLSILLPLTPCLSLSLSLLLSYSHTPALSPSPLH